MKRRYISHYTTGRIVSVVDRIGWFALGFVLGVAFIIILGLSLTPPAKSRPWLTPPMETQ